MAEQDPNPACPPLAPAEESDQRLGLVYRDQAPLLHRRLRARLGSSEEAADLVHDAFARLLSARPSAVRDHAAFLNRIVRNLLIDRARRLAARGPHVPIDLESDIAVRAEQSDEIEHAQMEQRYREVVATLPNRMREVFVLHRVQGLSYRQIADQLGISTRTVEWHIAEAIVRIGKGLDRD